jgi:hypothetical protein
VPIRAEILPSPGLAWPGLAAESWRKVLDRFAESWKVAAVDRQNPRLGDPPSPRH